MTNKLVVTALTTLVLGFATQYVAAAEVCKVL